MMRAKLNYEKLEKRIKELEQAQIECKLVEKKLKEIKNLYSRASELAKFGHWERDFTTNKAVWSKEVFHIFGVDPVDFEPSWENFLSVVNPLDRDSLRENVNNVLNHGSTMDFFYRIVHADGNERIIHSIGDIYVEEDSGTRKIVGTVHDVTEQKMIEKKLRESEKKYRNIFENAVEGIFISTPGGSFLEVNPSFATILGYDSPEDLVASITDITTEYYVDKEDRYRYRQKLQQEGSVDKMEYRVRRKDGSVIWISNSTRAYFDDEGAVVFYEGIINDITNRILDEKKKEQIQAQIVQSRKMEAIGILAGGIAHDFNNILSSIIGFTDLALEGAEKGSELEDDLLEISKAGKRAKDLVHQILMFARHSEEEYRPVRVDTIAKEVLKFIRSSIPTTIQIQSNIKSDSLIMGSATHIHQIFMNLLTNAAHAMDADGGILYVAVEDVHVANDNRDHVGGLKPGDYLQLLISDTGHGIPASIIDSIFEPYFTTKECGEGTGLGLAVVHGIVKSYHGNISVNSIEGRGSTFRIYLPVTRKRNQSVSYEPEALPGGSERILFVDDEIPIAKMGGKILKHLGYSVTTRTSSVEALELFRSKPYEFDLVISDMTMPNMTGDKFVSHIIDIRLDIPVILCTGYSKKITKDTISKLGIKALVYKPFVKVDMAWTVRKVLDGMQN